MPRPICIFLPNDKTLDPTAELKEFFTDEIGEHKLALISIAGSCREGKSFLLCFFMSYLRAAGEPNWMQNIAPNGEDGFRWERTSDPVTKGILIWPEYFKIKDACGEEIVVILMDTQGLYDANTSLQDSTSLFVLSVVLSSVQIFNVKENIKSDYLNNLELFTEFSRSISESSKQDPNSRQSPFQKLIFLVRDWQDPAEYAYGWEGGEARLRKLFGDAKVHGEIGSMRDNIKSCFESIKCFLMPHPGMEVARSTEFQGELSDIDEDFKLHAKKFIEEIFQPKNLRPKRFNGEELKVRQFADFVSYYVQELRSGEYPTIERLSTVTARAHNSAIVEKCFKEYSARLSRELENDSLEPSQFESLHARVLEDILAKFRNSKTMGDKFTVDKAFKDLEQRIADFVRMRRELNSLLYAKWVEETRKSVVMYSVVGLLLGIPLGAEMAGFAGCVLGGFMGALAAPVCIGVGLAAAAVRVSLLKVR